MFRQDLIYRGLYILPTSMRTMMKPWYNRYFPAYTTFNGAIHILEPHWTSWVFHILISIYSQISVVFERLARMHNASIRRGEHWHWSISSLSSLAPQCGGDVISAHSAWKTWICFSWGVEVCYMCFFFGGRLGGGWKFKALIFDEIYIFFVYSMFIYCINIYIILYIHYII